MHKMNYLSKKLFKISYRGKLLFVFILYIFKKNISIFFIHTPIQRVAKKEGIITQPYTGALSVRHT